MAAQWEEEQKLEGNWERRKIEGSSLQVEIMQKMPELLVHEHVTRQRGEASKREKETTRIASSIDKRKTKLLWWKTLKKW